MSRRNIIRTINEVCQPIIEELGYDLVDLEYIKEHGNNFLRFFIGKPEGIGIDDCQKISEIISERLDELDLIKESYYLEVSSPGLDRPLKTDRDLKRNIGRDVDISLYKAIDGEKRFSGELLDYDDEYIFIMIDNELEKNISRDIISQIKLALKF